MNIISFIKDYLFNSKAKETKKAKQAELGKKYYDSLKEGSEFKYVTSDGIVVTAKKFTPSRVECGKLHRTAACEVVDGIEIKKSAKRYPKFYQVIVPA